MSFTPEQSAIKVDKNLEEKLKTASAEEIRQIMADAAVEQGLVVPDAFSPDILLATGKHEQPQPQRFAKSFIVNGEKKIIESDSELGLAQAETALFRELMQTRESAEPAEPAQPRNDRGQFVSAEDAAAQVELRLRMVRGEITPEEFLASSGEIDKYLASQGVSVDDLREVSQSRFTSSWEQATQEFLQSTEGRDWPGGRENLRLISEEINSLNLIDAQDKMAALAQAYAELKRTGRLASNPDLQKQQEFQSGIANAQSFSDIKFATSLFGR